MQISKELKQQDNILAVTPPAKKNRGEKFCAKVWPPEHRPSCVPCETRCGRSWRWPNRKTWAQLSTQFGERLGRAPAERGHSQMDRQNPLGTQHGPMKNARLKKTRKKTKNASCNHIPSGAPHMSPFLLEGIHFIMQHYATLLKCIQHSNVSENHSHFFSAKP